MILGIDLGTTNSLAAVYRNGLVELVPNRFGSFLTPSVVSVAEDGTVLVGEEAKERLISAPRETASSFKRDMGTEREYRLGGRTFKPEELSALVLRSLVKDAEDLCGEKITEAVISVPAYFHDKQRTATQMAGELAGLTVRRIINEPSAAALASYREEDQEELFLVFDFGGGTLDVSIVSCFDTIVQIESVAGDNRLGGNDFDEVIARTFLAEHGLTRRSLSDKEYAVLLRRAEQCKRGLTDRDKARLSIEVDGELFTGEFTNRRLMQECGEIFAKIKNLLGRVLKDRRITTADISAVVLAGGSSRMPLVRMYLKHLFGRTPFIGSNPDEMIARGVGAVCGIISREGDLKDYVMTDISSFSLGTSIRNPNDPARNYMSVLIPRNTPLPCSKTGTYCTSHDDQTRVQIDVYQGEQPYAADNLYLGELTMNVPKAPAGEEKVQVRFTYDVDGVLVVEVTVLSTGQVSRKVFSKEVDEQKLKDKLIYLEQFKTEPKDQAENRLMMEKLKALFESAGEDLKPQVTGWISEFEKRLQGGREAEIRKYRRYLEKVTEQYEDYDPFVSAGPVLLYDENDYSDEDEFADEFDGMFDE